MKLLFYRQDALANWCTAVGLADSLNATLKPQLLRVQLSKSVITEFEQAILDKEAIADG